MRRNKQKMISENPLLMFGSCLIWIPLFYGCFQTKIGFLYAAGDFQLLSIRSTDTRWYISRLAVLTRTVLIICRIKNLLSLPTLYGFISLDRSYGIKYTVHLFLTSFICRYEIWKNVSYLQTYYAPVDTRIGFKFILIMKQWIHL